MIAYIFGDSFGFLENRDQLERFIAQFGIWAPLALVLLIVLEVVIAPLPGGIMPIIAGFLFGPILGIFYAWIGNMLGSIIAFWIARMFGERVVLFFAPSFNRENYGRAIKDNRQFFWFLYAFPFIPVDVLSFALGVSTITFRRFVYIIAGAFFLRMAFLVILGTSIANVVF